jgi:nucleoside-diphosphate-sugar epimerase
MKVLVMGGTRFMGLAVVQELLRRDHDVTLFNRGTRAVPWTDRVRALQGDRNDAAAMEQLRRLSFDGVIDLSAYTQAQTEKLLAVLPDVPRVVHCSTGAVYAPQPVLPWPESTPYGPWSLWGGYGREKLGCERILKTSRPRELATTVLRLPYVLGPENYADREEFVLNRLLDGAEILIPGDGLGVQQFVSARQVGQAMVASLEAFAGGGWRAFNIAATGFVSLQGFVEICAAICGSPPKWQLLGGASTGTPEDSFNPADAVFPFPNVNYVLDVSASARAGIAPAEDSVYEMIREAFGALMATPKRRSWSRTPAELSHIGAPA